MLDDRFFLIGPIDEIPEDMVNQYNLGYASEHHPEKKFPKLVDNVILILNNRIQVESGFHAYRLNGKTNHISFGLYDENYLRTIEYKKLFIILRKGITEKLLLQYRPWAKSNVVPESEWSEIFGFIEKNKYTKPWYVNLWNAIPSWNPLV